MFGLVNLVWGSLYGLPGMLFHWTRISHPLPLDLIWLLAWPIAATWLLGRLGARVAKLGPTPRLACLAVFALSFLAVTPVDRVMLAQPGAGFEFAFLPLYVRLLEY